MGDSSPAVEYLREESHPSSVSLEISPPRIDYYRQHDVSTMVGSSMVESPIEGSPMVQSPRIHPTVVQSSMIQSPVLDTPVVESEAMLESRMTVCMTPPQAMWRPLDGLCVTGHIQVPTNTPTIPGLTTSTKGAQSMLLKEAASKLETDTNTHMECQTHLEATQERVIPGGNNPSQEVLVRNYKLNTKAKRGRVEVETEDGGLTIDMEVVVDRT